MGERITSGVLLKVDKTTLPGATYVNLAEIRSIDGPNESVSSLDKTVLADSARKFRPGLYDGGEVSLEFNFDPANADHSWLRSQLKLRATRAWRIFIPKEEVDGDDFNIDFVGFLTEFGVSNGDVDDFITASVSIKVSGEVDYEVAE